MGSTNLFDLNTALEEWQQTNLKNKGLTPDDQLELFDHFCLTVDELSSAGLNEKESFTIAQIRFGEHEYWAEPMRELNEENYIARKVLNVFHGTLIYFNIFNTIFIILNIIFIGACSYYQNDFILGIEVFNPFWKWIYPITFVSVFAIFIFRKKLSGKLLDGKYNTKRVTSTVLIFSGLLILKHTIVFKIKDFLMVQKGPYSIYDSYRFHPYKFIYLFPLLIALCFVFLYLLLKYSKSIQ